MHTLSLTHLYRVQIEWKSMKSIAGLSHWTTTTNIYNDRVINVPTATEEQRHRVLVASSNISQGALLPDI